MIALLAVAWLLVALLWLLVWLAWRLNRRVVDLSTQIAEHEQGIVLMLRRSGQVELPDEW